MTAVFSDELRARVEADFGRVVDLLKRSAEFVADELRQVGIDAKVVQSRNPDGTPGAWEVIGSKIVDPQAPTVLLYAHHDVQPVPDPSAWDTDPFVATEVGTRLYGRGSADDGGGIAIHSGAMQALGDDLKVNIKVFVEGEEEMGSPSFIPFIEAHRDEFDAEAVVDRDDDPAVLADELEAYLQSVYDEKGKVLGEAAMKALERQVMLRIIDTRWMAHLSEMDYLKTGIGLRAFGQRDPLVEYKNEAYRAFQNLTSSMYSDYLRTILRLQIATKKETPQIPEQRDPLAGKVSYSSPEAVLDAPGVGDDERVPRPARAAGGVPKQAPREVQKPQTYVKDKDDPFANVGRNDPCPCGSGLKFKKCHGKDL